jgi:hypothetical protein
MGDESFLCEEKDPVSPLVNPDRMMGFFNRSLNQEKGPQSVKTPEPLQTDPGLRDSPLIKKNGLVDAGQHQMLTLPRRSGGPLQKIGHEIWDQSEHILCRVVLNF